MGTRTRKQEMRGCKGCYHAAFADLVRTTLSKQTPMTESEFHLRADQLMAAIDEAILQSSAADAAGIECDINAGILTLECTDGSKIIINRQTPMREVWLAAKGGGFHFRLSEDTWRDTRSGASLIEVLNASLADQCGTVIGITI